MILKQFKMANGDELICEIVQWPVNDEQEVVVRKILKINSADNYFSSTKYYSLRPYMSFFDDIGLLYILNPFHILCEVEPSPDLRSLYLETIQMIEEDLKSGKSKMSRVKDKLVSGKDVADEIMRNNAELFDSLIGEHGDQYNLDFNMLEDSAEQKIGNIVSFKKPKGTVH